MDLIACHKIWSPLATQTAYEDFARRSKALGYRGIEVHLADIPDPDKLCRLVKDELDLHLVLLIFSSHQSYVGPHPDFDTEQHYQQYASQLQKAVSYSPLRIVAHSGADDWDLAQSVAFYRRVAELEQSLGVQVAHETHRSRCFFNPFATLRILQQVPSICLNADFSHWTVVSDRMLNQSRNDRQVMENLLPFVIHIHARVGHGQAPQIPRPDHPAYQQEVRIFEEWWTGVWKLQSARGDRQTTFSAEYGPYPYTPYGEEINLESLTLAETQRLLDVFERRIKAMTPSSLSLEATQP